MYRHVCFRSSSIWHTRSRLVGTFYNSKYQQTDLCRDHSTCAHREYVDATHSTLEHLLVRYILYTIRRRLKYRPSRFVVIARWSGEQRQRAYQRVSKVRKCRRNMYVQLMLWSLWNIEIQLRCYRNFIVSW